MLKNQFKIALRNILRNKTYSFINIFGLTLGLASALLIVIYVKHEMSYDRFHKDSERIYRVSETVPLGENVKVIASTTMALAPNLRVDYPDLEQVTFFSRPQSSDLKIGTKNGYEERIHIVDKEFFNVFKYKFIIGSAENALSNINTVVITESLARKYFGDADPVGESIRINQLWGGNDMPFTISAVIEDMPPNSHFHMDMMVGTNSVREITEGRENAWGWDSGYTYVKVPEHYDIEQLNASFEGFIKKNVGENTDWLTYFTKPLTDIHLDSNLNSEIETNGNKQEVLIFALVALGIIFIAAINYINLVTALATKRSKEIGIHKVLGAGKRQMVRQFLTESFVITSAAMLAAGFLAEMATPFFNELAGRELEIGFLKNPVVLIAFISVSLIIGFLSGIYPAFYMSSFSAIKSLKGNAKGKNSLLGLRKGMLILQFGISIFLIVGSTMVFRQWNFMRNKSYGLNTETTLSFALQSNQNAARYDVLKNQLEANPAISNITTSHRQIGRDINSQELFNIEKTDTSFQSIRLSVIYVEPGFLEDVDIKLKSGRYFRENSQAETGTAVIINAAGEQLLDDKDALGKKVTLGRNSGTIIGVAENFHFESIYNEIKPIVFIPTNRPQGIVTLTTKSDQLSEVIGFLSETWQAFDPTRGFRYSIISDDIKSLYGNEERFLQLFTAVTGLAIFIASLGIFGLVSFSAFERTKEIGIRKVLGANTLNITMLLTREYLILIVIANLIAWPVAYWFSESWLSNYSYRTPITWWPFILATLAAVVIASLTAMSQTLKAAHKNPVNSLRYE
ncbi:MAG: ABC transporter permease [Rhodobacteraceae bacterium]|nr:ABC transporter permease [Paracoccaceae bacterium]